MGLVGHQWALVRAGRAPLDGFLQLALALGAESDPDVLIAVREPLDRSVEAAERSLGQEPAAALRARIEAAFAPALDAMGLRKAERDGELECLRRAVLFSLVGSVAEQEALRAPARAACEAYLERPDSLDPELADPVVSLAAAHGDAALFDRLLHASDEAGTPQERRRFRMALADFRDPVLVDRTLSLCTGPRVATQDVAILFTRLLGNRHAREATWATMKRRWAKLERRLPPLLITRPIQATPALGTRAYRREVAAFFRENPVSTGARAVRQALEQFDLELAFDRRAEAELRRFLDGSG
jgi:aminopeptidase N/puromycin-sensitive aminopeptidase